jgi:peptide/nickel transport system substrate-binding protein
MEDIDYKIWIQEAKKMKKRVIVIAGLAFAIALLLVAFPAAAQAKRGGTLRAAIEAEPAGLDPDFIQSNLVAQTCDLVYDHLWRWDYEFKSFVPQIAERWEWVDKTHFKIYVRKGVLFHNGREVKAEDVKYSIERILDPKTGSPSAAYLKSIESVTVNGPYTLTLNLSNPWYGIQEILQRHGAIIPREAVEEYGDLKAHPIGSGPFVLESWEPGLQMTFKRFDGYWMKDKPYLDKIVLRFMPEYNTAKNALLAGEVDIITWPDSADIESLKANKDLKLWYYNVNAMMYVGINTKNKPLDNVKVRQAIALATNRNSYNDALYRGIGKPAWTPIPTSQPYYRKSWEKPLDLAKAKRLLAEAGYRDGFKVRILALKGSEEIMGEVLQNDLAAIGVQGEVTIAEIPVALDAIFNKLDFDLCVLGDVISPDPDLFLSNYMIPEGGAAGAAGRWDNARVKQLVKLGRETYDLTSRVKIYQEAYDIILDQVPMVFLVWPVRHPASRNYVKGWFSWGDVRYDYSSVWLDK